MSKIELIDVKKSYDQTEIVKGVNITVEEGEFAVVVGPSGCGKSTLLRMIAGLEDITCGELRFDGELMNHVSPDKRGIAMVFQSYALYPHMTVAENIGFALSLQKVDKKEIAARVRETAKMLELTDLLNRKPSALSGGQRQRVAIGRAVVKRPKVILFDEPLSNLDAKLRVQMRAELMRLHKEFGSTIIYVTHDQVEAMTMAQKIIVLNQGRVAQAGAPMNLYKNPRDTFVAQFIGIPQMNMLAGALEGNQFTLRSGGVVELAQAYALCGDARLGIRPEHLQISENGTGPAWQVSLVERLGVETFVHLRSGSGENVVLRQEGDIAASEGQRVHLHFAPEKCYLFGPSSKRILPEVPASEVVDPALEELA